MKTTENRGSIMVVDDDPAVLVLVQSILTSVGYRPLLAATGEDALHLAQQKHIHMDLALLDIRMPGLHGPQLANEILAVRPNIRILFMSGFVEEEMIRIKALDRNAHFLPKPFKTAGLLQAIEGTLQAEPSKPFEDHELEGMNAMAAAASQLQ